MSLLLLLKTQTLVPTVAPPFNSGGFMITTTAYIANAVTAGIAVDGSATKRGPNQPILCVLENTDASVTVYVGGATVDKTGVNKGLSLAPGAQLALEIIYTDIVYIIAATGTPVITVFLARL